MASREQLEPPVFFRREMCGKCVSYTKKAVKARLQVHFAHRPGCPHQHLCMVQCMRLASLKAFPKKEEKHVVEGANLQETHSLARDAGRGLL